MYPLLVCSIVAVSVAIERILVLILHRDSYDRFVLELETRLTDLGVEGAKTFLANLNSPLAHVAGSILNHVHVKPDTREEIVNREASEQIAHLEKRINWLSIIGTLAPMIGLLGTVIGLVEAFYQIEQQGGQVQPGDLASGIWTALLTTVFGLTVALPTLAIYHFLDNRIAAITLRMTWVSSRVNQWLEMQNVSENGDN